MNEPSKTVSPSKANGGTNPASAANANVAAPPAKVPAPGAGAPSAVSPAPFGGHMGGRKKREDGLASGSPEAKEADRIKDAARKKDERATKKVSTLPPPLPSVAATIKDAGYQVVDGAPAVSAAVAGAGFVAGPVFVPWTTKILEKPVRLITKIIDKIRCHALMKYVRKLGLNKEQEKEISEGLAWQERTVEDFQASLAECASIELNKHRVAGANYSHYVALAMSTGEMVMAHIDTMDRLQKMVLENKALINSAPSKTGP